MNRRFRVLLGKLLLVIGALLIFSYASALLYNLVNPYQSSSIEFIPMLQTITIIFLGFVVVYAGASNCGRYQEETLHVIKNGDFIHSARVWNTDVENGLLLTICGKLVSIQQHSDETAHVGYRYATAQQPTCRECCEREGRRIMDSAKHHDYG